MGIQSKYDGQFTTEWDNVLASRTNRMQSSIIRELLMCSVFNPRGTCIGHYQGSLGMHLS